MKTLTKNNRTEFICLGKICIGGICSLIFGVIYYGTYYGIKKIVDKYRRM